MEAFVSFLDWTVGLLTYGLLAPSIHGPLGVRHHPSQLVRVWFGIE